MWNTLLGDEYMGLKNRLRQIRHSMCIDKQITMANMLNLHLSGLNVKVGYPVIAGTKIGNCGNTGRSFGSHLHFEIRKNGICQDPMNYLN